MKTLEQCWKRKVISTLVRTEAEFGASSVGEIETDWEARILKRIFDASHPAAHLECTADFYNARKLGAIVGHKMAHQEQSDKNLSRVRSRINKLGFTYSDRIICACFGLKEEDFLRYLNTQSKADSNLVKRAISRILAIVAHNGGRDAAEFMDGYAMALKKGTFSSSLILSGESPATPIYKFLLSYGRVCQERLYSLAELHEVLRDMYGSQVIGDRARLKKICERVGFKITRRGRPQPKRDIREIKLSLFREMEVAKDVVDADIRRLQQLNA